MPVAKVAAMEAAHKAVEVDNKRIQAELEEKTTELAELKTKVRPSLSFPLLISHRDASCPPFHFCLLYTSPSPRD